MVTGSTGLVGGHSVAALLDAGHEVTALVRDRGRLRAVAEGLGVELPRHVVGDMTDPAAVDEALEGADAVLHCAALVSIDRRDEAAMISGNLEGTRLVLSRARAAGCDPIVHTSSTSALFRPWCAPLRPDMDVSDVRGGYGRSKALCELEARDAQADGAPVSITYPGGILGPPAGTALGETAQQLARFIAAGVMPTRRAALSIIDVRDLAAVNLALLESPGSARRIMCGGHLVDMFELARQLRGLTGRRFPVPPVPPAALRLAGRGVDALRRVVDFETPVGQESMTLVTTWPGTDDSSMHELGIRARPLRETLEVSLRAWVDAGLVTPRQVGTLLTG